MLAQIKMKIQVLSIDGKKAKEIDMPKFFSSKIRRDIVAKVLESKKIKQPYSPSPMAGNLYSSGKASHRRHVWKTAYGKGISRIPRKIFSRRGDQFNWEGATIPGTKGGRRAHPPKILHMLTRKRINKKEMQKALESAISATASQEKIKKRYSMLEGKKIENLPFVVEAKITSLKSKEMISSLKKILGEPAFEVAIRKKNIRSGRGKLRGRKYKSTAGMIMVTGKKESIKTGMFEVAKAENLSVASLSRGGSGRIAVYTENAIKELNEKYRGKNESNNN